MLVIDFGIIDTLHASFMYAAFQVGVNMSFEG